MADRLAAQMANASVSDQPAQNEAVQLPPATGKVALLEKMKPHPQPIGAQIKVATNVRKVVLEKNKPIYKYDVSIVMHSVKADGTECQFEVSKSFKSRAEHEQDKNLCHRVYEQAVRNCPELKKGGPYFYDRQSSLYSLTKIADELRYTAKGGNISPRDSFQRAEFTLKKVQESFQTSSNDVPRTVNACPALIDKTLHEALNLMISAPAIDDPNVLTINNCVHYLYGNIPPTVRTETGLGGKCSAVGAKKSIKTLEGREKTPTLFMTTEMKTTFFHPDDSTLLDVLKGYPGFSIDLQPNSPFVLKNKHAFIGLKLFRNYGRNAGIGEDGSVLRISGFGLPACQHVFAVNGKNTTVEQYFKTKYGITLRYPKLFTISAKGKFSNTEQVPVELLNVVNGQVVTTEQMSASEQEKLVKLSADKPHIRKATTEQVVNSVGIASETIHGFINVGQPEIVNGLLLPKPTIVFAKGQKVNWNDPKKKGPDSDFMAAGQFFQPAKLSNWEVCFNAGEALQDVISLLMSTMTSFGMQVNPPKVTYISGGNLNAVFEKAKANKVELLLIITKRRYDYHAEMKMLEQKYQVLTQDVQYETAEKLAQQQNTRKNIVNKLNVKLGGLNYVIESPSLKPGTLVIGFETSQKNGGGGDYPIAVGYSANMGNHYQKFLGGYEYVNRSKDVYGPVLKKVIVSILQTSKNNGRGKPEEMVIYFNGVTEGQYAMLNETYSAIVKEACSVEGTVCRPHITIIASSKTHNERLYKMEPRGVSNLDAGTVVDSVIVSPVLNEFYLASAVARQGTVKTTKYTVVFSTNRAQYLYNIERLTNDLCFLHEIIFHPVGLPAPLYHAGSNSERGAKVLATHRFSPVLNSADGTVNLAATNEDLGYFGKKLLNTRFNA